MDRAELTPYLRRRVFALSIEGRLQLIAELTSSLNGGPSPATRLADMLGAMESLEGLTLRGRSKCRATARARAVFAYCARLEHYTTIEIGEVLGLDHSSIVQMGKKMDFVLLHPALYPDYMALLDAYSKTILQ